MGKTKFHNDKVYEKLKIKKCIKIILQKKKVLIVSCKNTNFKSFTMSTIIKFI